MTEECREKKDVHIELVRNVKSLYGESRASVRWERGVGEYFEVRRGFIERYVMSPLLFNIIFDSAVGQVNDNTTGKGVELRSVSGRRLEIKQTLFADDTVLID